MRVAQLVGFLVFYYYSLMEKKSKAVMLTLEQQASSVFDHYCYQDEGLKPCAYFWKELIQAK